jgi:hypothetical protein
LKVVRGLPTVTVAALAAGAAETATAATTTGRNARVPKRTT